MIRRFTHKQGFEPSNGRRVLFLEVDDANSQHFRRVYTNGTVEKDEKIPLSKCLSFVRDGEWVEIDPPLPPPQETVSEVTLSGVRYKVTTTFERIS